MESVFQEVLNMGIEGKKIRIVLKNGETECGECYGDTIYGTTIHLNKKKKLKRFFPLTAIISIDYEGD